MVGVNTRFIAKEVKEYLNLVNVNQEITHIATPEENAHIESYHGILKREVLSKYEYFSFGELQQLLKQYVHFYNFERLHGLLGKITPMEKYNQDKNKVLKRVKTA